MKHKLSYVFAVLSFFLWSNLSIADDLLQVYQQALASDPQLLKSKAQSDAAKAAIGRSRASLLPQISAEVGYSQTENKERKVANIQENNLGISIEQSLFRYENWLGFSIAEKNAAEFDARYANELQTLMSRVANAYFDVLYQTDYLTYTKASSRALERQLNQVRQKFRVGLVAVSDVQDAKARYDESISKVIDAENKLENSYESLREITGVENKNLAQLEIKRFSTSKPAPDSKLQWVDIAKERNPEILAQRLAKDIAQERIGESRAGWFPSASLRASQVNTFNGKSGENFDTETKDNTTTTIGVTVSIPIFSGLRTLSSYEEAKFNYVSASEDLERTYRRVNKNVRSNFNNIQSSISQVKASYQAVISAQSALRATRAGFEVGTKTIVNVLDDTQRLYEKKSQLSRSRFDYIKATLALKLAAGNLTKNDLELINVGLYQPKKKASVEDEIEQLQNTEKKTTKKS